MVLIATTLAVHLILNFFQMRLETRFCYSDVWGVKKLEIMKLC